MNNLPVLFNYENAQIRTFTKEDNTVWFAAVDICQALGLVNVTKAVKRVEEDDLTSIQCIDSMGRPQEINIINESGLYTLVLSSKKKEAKDFKRWITKDVLPQIRQTGGYQKAMSPEELAVYQATNILNLRKDMDQIKGELNEIKSQQAQNIEKFYEVEKSNLIPFQETTRVKIHKLINAFVRASQIPYNLAWDKLYTDYRLRYGIDLKQRAKNKGRGVSGLQIAEELFKLEELFSLASEVLDIEKFSKQLSLIEVEN